MIKKVEPGDIIIKNGGVLRGLMERTYAPLLIDIILEVVRMCGIRMSESWRIPRHAGDVHSTSPVRAVDITSWVYSDVLKRGIEKHINALWEYDFNRPKYVVARIHKVKDGVFHFHIQVHQNTRRRNEATNN
jgi:hypothetical protein